MPGTKLHVRENFKTHDMLNALEVASIIDVDPRTLANWRGRRKGPKFIRIGSNVRYRRADLESWVKSQTVETTN
jgi:hypothetical protein